MSKHDFFIGWAETPKVDRRFFMGAGLAMIAVAAGTSASLARFQNAGGTGSWDMSAIREWRGIASSEPYAMLRTYDLDGTARTALLACQGKCGVTAKIGALSGKPVVVKGSLIQRGNHAMIAVIDGMDWIAEDTGDLKSSIGDLTFPTPEDMFETNLQGEILDTKCWFGAMRPASGKVHKSCASLCIRHGLPPAFYVEDIKKQKALMLMTEGGQGFGHDILPFVADPLEVHGTIKKFGDLLLFDTRVSQFNRL